MPDEFNTDPQSTPDRLSTDEEALTSRITPGSAWECCEASSLGGLEFQGAGRSPHATGER